MHLRKSVFAIAAGVVVGSATILGTTLGSVATTNSRFTVNGSVGQAQPARAAHCIITNDSGATVSVVNIDELKGSDTVYWISYNGFASGSSETISIKGPNGDLLSETQKLAGYTGGASLPFGIPFWAGNQTSGTYHVTVKAVGGPSQGCSFTTNP
jgi:hypothetical protein